MIKIAQLIYTVSLFSAFSAHANLVSGIPVNGQAADGNPIITAEILSDDVKTGNNGGQLDEYGWDGIVYLGDANSSKLASLAHSPSGLAAAYHCAQTGVASRYHDNASACPGLHQSGDTAASLTLPCGTRVRVTNVKSRASIVVTIVDRGPYVKGRIIDLAPKAADAIDITDSVGVGSVQLSCD